MKTLILSTPLLGALPLTLGQTPPVATLSGGLPQSVRTGNTRPESVRHILLGSPEAIRQTIYLLHTLRYAETGLWSPVMGVGDGRAIAPAPDEAMSLLRRPV